MKDALVGYSGFVGSNLRMQHTFSDTYNSSNIEAAFGTTPDMLVYAGVRAEMFLANQDPNADYQMIRNAMENIRRITPKRLVLISTVAVYADTKEVNEDSVIAPESLSAYGRNRLVLEQWVRESCPKSLIVRLPAIFGENLKKNFLYDYITGIPALLKNSKYVELLETTPELARYYFPQENGFYKCRELSVAERSVLKGVFARAGFSALNFTDSRSRYQFYPLSRLWKDICLALENDVRCINMVTPPVSANDVYEMLEGKAFENELDKRPFDYDIFTKHAGLFGRPGERYIMSLEEELDAIRQFIAKHKGDA